MAAAALAAVVAISAQAQEAEKPWLEPDEEAQGGFAVLRIATEARAGTASALGRKVPLFPIPGGLRGIIPVPLKALPGRQRVAVTAGGRQSFAFLRIVGRDVGPVSRLPLLVVSESESGSLAASRTKLAAVWRGVTAEPFWSADLRWPVPGRITAVFGITRAYGGGASWPHRGVDFAVPAGWPVVACAAGRVAMSRRLQVYGNMIVIDHGQTVFTAYMHLTSRLVEEGARVEQGQIIGQAGATGLASGSHLHFGVYIAGIAVDPMEVLDRGLPTEESRIRESGEEEKGR